MWLDDADAGLCVCDHVTDAFDLDSSGCFNNRRWGCVSTRYRVRVRGGRHRSMIGGPHIPMQVIDDAYAFAAFPPLS